VNRKTLFLLTHNNNNNNNNNRYLTTFCTCTYTETVI